jgi:hypothetical protein
MAWLKLGAMSHELPAYCGPSHSLDPFGGHDVVWQQSKSYGIMTQNSAGEDQDLVLGLAKYFVHGLGY